MARRLTVKYTVATPSCSCLGTSTSNIRTVISSSPAFAMSFSLARTDNVTPEVRLAAAISEFEASLDPERKVAFRNHRFKSCESLPSVQDVMQITAEFNEKSTSKKPGSGGWGARLTNFLEAVQQYAAVGDIIVGGSQNIIACGVYSLVRLTLLSVVATSARIAEVTTFFMKVGLSAPRYDRLALLYPQSKRLAACMSEYYIVVVRFCHQLVTIQKKPAYLQLVSFMDDLCLKTIQSKLETSAASIKEEIETLKTEEHTSHLRQLMRSSDSEAHRRKLRANLRVLTLASTYDYKDSWKKLRKKGTSTVFKGMPAYLDWVQQKGPSTLLCIGRLGSGKSVCLASMVDDLNLAQRPKGIPVAFFFCRHDIHESLQADTVLASMGCQLLREFADLSNCLATIGKDETTTTLEMSDVLRMLVNILPPNYVAYFVLGGLDECNNAQRDFILTVLNKLQSKFTLLVCCSSRYGAETFIRRISEYFPNTSSFTIPEENPDIGSFIQSELERRLQSGLLAVGRPEMILEIRHELLTRAKGMFLWVSLQIDSLCAARTDEAIRQALDDLPGDLPDMYLRILKKSAPSSPEYQRLIFELILGACRPLNTDELREALSVEPGDATWAPDRIINDVNSVLACCGSLASVDEETSTVELIHGSVRQFLDRNFAKYDERYCWLRRETAATMADIVITYLNYSVFESQISTTSTPNMESATMPSKIIRSIDSAIIVRKLALRLLANKDSPQSTYNLGKVLHGLQDRSVPENSFHFYGYAKKYWSEHVSRTTRWNAAVQSLQDKLLRREIKAMQAGDPRIHKIFRFAVLRNYHTEDIFDALIDLGAEPESRATGGFTPLMLAAAHGNTEIVQRLAAMGVNIETPCAEGLTPLARASKNGFYLVVEFLLQHHAKLETRCRLGRTPLAWAACNQADVVDLKRRPDRDHVKVTRLLIKSGAELEAKRLDGRTVLGDAATGGIPAVVRVLVEAGADWTSTDEQGVAALLRIVDFYNERVLSLFIEMAEPTLLDTWGERLLLRAAEENWPEAVDMLVRAGVHIKGKGHCKDPSIYEAT
ncbi:hypothetical protein JDV02_002342 [Purpureocillium takamizusanense]|uniref:NACHT domain-containing protein n=1 Tax=Purpureocillium takamizusanense TaxID=2060973 RepID=A0A9Q8Q948_9HYPO|nr:uncharacterized protein JDV02_002342 [Purpureocillium takamizusanense]UNI15848.1 hypothetical protein JDV02_002342 [Purpureocillium takamizusanense]